MLRILAGSITRYGNYAKTYATNTPEMSQSADKFETVFEFPFIKYLALFNRLKAYHIAGSSLAVPGSGILEMLQVIPEQSFVTATYLGVTGAILLAAASFPFNNTIGFLYISDDNKFIKISSLNFWGKRVDKIVPADDWIPLLDMGPKQMDIFYYAPQLTDKSKYKLFLRFGKVLNSKKMSEVLE